MKKLTLTLAIVLGLTVGGFAQGGGLFQRGDQPQQERYGISSEPVSEWDMRFGGLLPTFPVHNQEDNQDAAPLGGGVLLLAGLGAAYAIGKKRKEE